MDDPKVNWKFLGGNVHIFLLICGSIWLFFIIVNIIMNSVDLWKWGCFNEGPDEWIFCIIWPTYIFQMIVMMIGLTWGTVNVVGKFAPAPPTSPVIRVVLLHTEPEVQDLHCLQKVFPYLLVFML